MSAPPASVKVLLEPSTVDIPLNGPQGPAVVKVTAPGQIGPPGPPGPVGASGQPRWTGQGPPGVVIGAEPGDEYLDESTGDIYRLI